MKIPGILRGGRARVCALMGLLLLVATACAANAPQDYLNQQAGPVARKADQLWDITFGIAVAIFFIVEGAIVYALIRFRERPGRKAAQFHGNPKLEVVLTLVPALILGGLAVPTLATVVDLAREPAAPLRVTVVGHQFWWEYQYDLDGDGTTDIETANELHIPVGKTVRFTIIGDPANNDVIHSFWIPLLGGTQDVIPGRVNHITYEASRPGLFLGQCKEFCGLSHANMRLRAYASPQQEFDRWVAEQREPVAPAAAGSEGARLFLFGTDGKFPSGPPCATCHAVKGLEMEIEGQVLTAGGTLGPDLTHLAQRETFASAMFPLNEQNLRRWLEDPPAMKPGVLMPDLGLKPDQIDALVDFLLSLE